MTSGARGPGASRLIGRVLVASLDADRPLARRTVRALLAGGVPADLAVAARWHRIAGFLLDAVRGDERLDPLAGELESACSESAYHELRALADLRRVAAVLDATGEPWLVMKGPVLADRYYGAAGLRSFDDVDVLVPARALGTALDALVASGCAEADQNWSLMTDLRAGEATLRGPLGTPLDIHWTLLFDGALRDRFAIDVDAALDRARTVRVADADVPTFDAADTLNHLCLHAAMDGGSRLIWLKDVERCVAVDAPPWDAVVERALAWRVGVPVGLLLARARHALGVPVPRAVTRRLLGGIGSAIAAGVDAGWPVGRASDRGSPARLLARSARATMPQTWRELGGRMGRVRGRHLREVLSPARKTSRSAALHRPGTSGATRATFVASVTPLGAPAVPVGASPPRTEP